MLEFQDPAKLVPLWTFLTVLIAAGAALAGIDLSVLTRLTDSHRQWIRIAGIFLVLFGLVAALTAMIVPQSLALFVALLASLFALVLPGLRQLVLTVINAILFPFRLLWRAMVRVYLAIIRASVRRAFPWLPLTAFRAKAEAIKRSEIEELEAKIEELYKAMPSNSIIGVRAKWPDVLEHVKAKNIHVEALLKSCEPIALEGNELVLGFYYPFHKDRVEDPKAIAVFEESLEEVLGVALKVKCVIHPPGRKRKRAPDF